MERVALVSSVLLYILPATFLATLTAYTWHGRQVAAAVPLRLLLGAVVFWSACHAASMASATFFGTLRWAQVKYGGVVLVGPLWLLFVAAYRRAVGADRRLWLVSLLPAALSYAAVLTNDWHHLWWPTVALDGSRPFGSLAVTRGALFWLHFAYSYGCVLLGVALLAPAMRQRGCAAMPARLLAASVLIPAAGNLAFLFGLRATAVDDPTPILFATSGLLIVYAALRYRFLDPAPLTAQELIEGLPDGLVVMGPPDVVAAVNAAAPGLLAACPGGWEGASLLARLGGSPLERELRALLAEPGDRSVAYAHPQGLRAVELRLRPLPTSGGHRVLVVRDCTAAARHARQQAELRAGATPEPAAVPQTVATVVHELRSPLTSIIAYTELLQRGTFGALPPRSTEALGRIRHSGARLVTLINDVLDITRLEAGHIAVELAPTDLNAVIGDAVAAVQPQIQGRGLALRVELAPHLPPVQANRERLEQVILNLLTNALKFTDAGAIAVRTAHAGERAAFSVADTGIGIPPEQQRAIFQAFQQVDNEHTRRSHGTGLGLAISQGLMHSMGGALRVESEPGVGSTFHGELQFADEQLIARERGAP